MRWKNNVYDVWLFQFCIKARCLIFLRVVSGEEWKPQAWFSSTCVISTWTKYRASMCKFFLKIVNKALFKELSRGFSPEVRFKFLFCILSCATSKMYYCSDTRKHCNSLLSQRMTIKFWLLIKKKPNCKH